MKIQTASLFSFEFLIIKLHFHLIYGLHRSRQLKNRKIFRVTSNMLQIREINLLRCQPTFDKSTVVAFSLDDRDVQLSCSILRQWRLT